MDPLRKKKKKKDKGAPSGPVILGQGNCPSSPTPKPFLGLSIWQKIGKFKKKKRHSICCGWLFFSLGQKHFDKTSVTASWRGAHLDITLAVSTGSEAPASSQEPCPAMDLNSARLFLSQGLLFCTSARWLFAHMTGERKALDLKQMAASHKNVTLLLP